MAVLKLVKEQDKILHTAMEFFDFKNPPIDPIELAKDLAETMIDNKGIGLALNQTELAYKYPYQVLCVSANPIICMFNPKIVSVSGDEHEMDEGCLSYPNLYLNIKRPFNVRVRYTLPNGQTETKIFDGLTARIIQHEEEHLRGITFTSHVSKMKLDIAKRKSKKQKRNLTFSYNGEKFNYSQNNNLT